MIMIWWCNDKKVVTTGSTNFIIIVVIIIVIIIIAISCDVSIIKIITILIVTIIKAMEGRGSWWCNNDVSIHGKFFPKRYGWRQDCHRHHHPSSLLSFTWFVCLGSKRLFSYPQWRGGEGMGQDWLNNLLCNSQSKSVTQSTFITICVSYKLFIYLLTVCLLNLSYFYLKYVCTKCAR